MGVYTGSPLPQLLLREASLLQQSGTALLPATPYNFTRKPWCSTLQPTLWYIPLRLPELHKVPGTKLVLNKHLLNKGMNK